MLNKPQTSYVQRGETINYKNEGASLIQANAVVPLASRIGIAANEIAVGAVGSLNVVGVYDIPALNTEAFTVGQAAYWTGTAITTTAGSNVPAGWIVEAKVTAGTIARVKIG